MEELAKQHMLQGMSYGWSGLALEEVEAGGKAILIFGIGLLMVYLTLWAVGKPAKRRALHGRAVEQATPKPLANNSAKH